MASLAEEDSQQGGKNRNEYEEYLEKHPSIRRCLEDDCDVDTQDENGRTAVFHLMQSYHPTIADHLFRKNPDVNIPDYDGIYPIHLATKTGPDALNILIKYGADKTVVDKYKRTPLHYAASYGSYDVIGRLLQDEQKPNEKEISKTFVNAVDVQGNTAAHYAAMRNEGRYLLTSLQELGANTSTKNIHGKLPLHYASRKALMFFTNQSKEILNDHDNENKTILHHFSSFLNTKNQVKELIEKGINVEKCDCKGRNALMLACKDGSTETVKLLLKSQNIDVNFQDNQRNTALHYACRRKEGMSHAKVLIENGADINKQNILEKTPLMNAIETQINETAKILILPTVNLQIKDRASRSLLHYAILSASNQSIILKNTMDIIKKLCEMGIDVDGRDIEDMTSLHYACQVKGGRDIVKLLVENGADVHIVDRDKLNPIHHAIKYVDFDTVQFLVDHIININHFYQPDDNEVLMAAKFASIEVLELLCKNKRSLKSLHDREDFLHCLCHRQRKEILQFFLQHELDINVQDKDGNSLLFISLQYSAHDIVNHLLRNGADTTRINNNGQHPLHLACKFSDLETVELLWDFCQQQKKISDIEDHFKRTTLHYAAQNSRTGVFEFLLTKGINVNAQDEDGKTALHFGGEYLTEKAVDLFVKYKGNINARDCSDRSALYFAAQEGNLPLVKCLLNLGIKIESTLKYSTSPLVAATLGLKSEVVETLLELRPNKEFCNDFGSSLVHYSVTNSAIQILNVLLKSEYPLTPIEGNSPLHIASQLSNLEAVRTILRFQSGRNILNDRTETECRSALHIASKNGDKNIVYTLSICGAKLNLKDKEGKTALHLAVNENHVSITSLLVFHGADINIADKTSATALHMTVERNNMRLTSLLVKSGASTNAKDANGDKPLALAKCPEMRRILEHSEVSECKFDEVDQSYKDLPIHENVCLLEMRKRYLPAVGLFYMPTKQAKKAVDYIQRYLEAEERANVNFLIYERNREIVQTFKTRVGLLKYACLYLAAEFSSSIPDDITKHCYDLNVVITEVIKNHQVKVNIEDLAAQIREAKENSLTEVSNDNKEHQIPSTSKDRPVDPYLKENVGTEVSKDEKSLTVLQLLQKYLCRLGLLNDEDTYILSGSEIHTWIRRKNWHQTYSYIQKRGLLDKQDNFGWTPLHHCIMYNMEEFVLLFLQNGVNVNIYTTDIIPFSTAFTDADIYEDSLHKYLSPLFLAVILERSNIIRYLADEHVLEDDIKTCVGAAFGGNSELHILNSLCRQLERRYSKHSLRAFPGYLQETPLKRTLLGTSPRIFRTKKDIFLSLDVLIRNPDYCNNKEHEDANGKHRYLTSEEGNLVKQMIATHASRLWQSHSGLNIITGAYLQNNKACVAVYVTIKEFVPLFERPIPKTLQVNNVELDVILIEGNAALGKNGDPSIYMAYSKLLQIGSAIGSLGGLSGTIGPIVSLDEDNLGFISCAHIFFSDDISNGRNIPIKYDRIKENIKKAVQPTDAEEEMQWENYRYNKDTEQTEMDTDESESITHHRDSEWRVCGEVIRAVFDPGYHDAKAVSIDAALIKITVPERKPKDGKFCINPLPYSGLSYRPVFDSGEIGIIKDDVLGFGTEVIKCGAVTGITSGAVVFDGAQVRLTTDSQFSLCCCYNRAYGIPCSCTQPKYTMKGQYQVQSNNNQSFFELGDSGAGVFLVDKDKHLICVGIAIGRLSRSEAIVTPIEHVLKSLGDYKLKRFIKRPCDTDLQHDEHHNVKRSGPSQ